MTTLKAGSKSIDRTYGTYVSTIWTTIEANTGIICACLPMLRSPLSRVFPRLFLRDTQENASQYDGGTHHPSKPRQTDFDSWGRFGSGKPTYTQSATIASPTHGPRSSDEEIFGMAAITKTTDIRVDYGDHRPSGSTSTNDHDSMTIPHRMSPNPHQFTGHVFS